ncbi:MAG TPA: DUF1015 domain-containing protein [Terriglobales bacterium]
MATISPFRALRYDPSRAPLSDVVTQPYDKIHPAAQEHYYQVNPHNLVRIILGKISPSDDEVNNVYSRAATHFADWRREGVFLQDSQPSIYVYSQRFTMPGGKEEIERTGFIALGHLEDYSSKVVFRHEHTLAKPKADRLNLLRATRAHFGQLFMLYSDPGAEIEGLLAPRGEPDMNVRDEYGVSHRVWRIADSTLIELVRGKMQDKKLIIADGHHRYETALAYRDERRTAPAAGTGIPRERSSAGDMVRSGGNNDAPFEYAMMTFINMDSPGLMILPTHRLVHSLSSLSPETFAAAASEYFEVEEVDASVDAPRATSILREAGRSGTALLAITAERAFLLDRAKTLASESLREFSPQQQELDVVQLHKCVLERVLGISAEATRNQENISYTREASEALAKVRDGSANIAFLMNPVRMEQVREIAFAGEVLPQKSTDFYPKLLSGLTIYALE